jgi:hypothetical protein
MQGKGPAEIIQQISQQLEDKFLPPQLKIVFDFQDDGQDERVADIRNKRSERHERDVNDGIITLRVAREQMLEDGDLTREQFIQLELDDGRLENGSDVMSLLDSRDPFVIDLLDLGVDDPADIFANDAEEMLLEIAAARQDAIAIVNEGSSKQGTIARGVLGALNQLEKSYQQLLVEEQVTQEAEEEPEQPASEEEEPEEEADVI